MNNQDIVNKSGFPLQIAIENLVGYDGKHNDWRVIYSEHSWENNNESGFIDLILELCFGGIFVLVVECKRVLNSSWLFFNSKGELNKRRHSKAWVSQYGGEGFKQFNWKDIALDPVSPECEYCTILGQDNKSKPMLERVSSTLVKSTEAFANEERGRFSDADDLRVYLNVIVTTAKLEVCSFDPDEISIGDGTIKNCSFTEVPFLRFRKQLQNNIDPSFLKGKNYKTIASAKENSIFIINSEHVREYLDSFDPGKYFNVRI